MIIDTTYLLPLAKIDVPTDIFAKILAGEIDIDVRDLGVNSISIFELQAKASKYNIPSSFVVKAVNYIRKYLEIYDFWERDILETSFELRKILSDYIDCVILATAIRRDKILLTEDSRLLKIRKQVEDIYGVKIVNYKELLEGTIQNRTRKREKLY